MFHSLFEFQDQNMDFNRQSTKSSVNHMKNSFKIGGPNDIYFGKGNYVIDQYNKNKNDFNRRMEKETQFQNTKNKIRLVVYKNGFILNNGQFRDRSIPENDEFLNEVEKGQIPQELIRKGIKDLGILLINRKTEIYNSPYTQSINPLHFTFNFYQNSYQNQNEFINPYSQNLNQYNSFGFPNNSFPIKNSMSMVSQTPIGTRNLRNNLSLGTIDESVEDLIRGTALRKTMTISNKYQSNENKVVDILEFKKKEPQDNNKFTAFSGCGKLIGNINTEGLHVNKEIKSQVDRFQPVCSISIRLFNGEIIKAEFNNSQTLRDIYIYVRNISGSNNFVLLDGFPPKPLIEYGRSIGELGLQNTMLTQKIN